VYVVQCPTVQIEAHNKEFRATVSSRNTTLFRLHVPEHLRRFSGVQELCEYWPLAVKALNDHVPLVQPGQAARPPVEFVSVSIIIVASLSYNTISRQTHGLSCDF